jgi:hypothetical protein
MERDVIDVADTREGAIDADSIGEVVVSRDAFGRSTEVVVAESELARQHWDERYWRRLS